jgi:hypothetical protein
VLGGSAPKRGGWGIKAKPGHEYKPPKDDAGAAFVPRSQKKKGKETKDDSGSKYMDRAERRRLGLDDEYKPVRPTKASHGIIFVDVRWNSFSKTSKDVKRRKALIKKR